MKNIDKNIGKVFEQNIKLSCPDWVFVYRPPDAAQSFNMNSNLRFSQHSPADFFLFNGNNGIFYAFECKTFQGSCSFERTKSENGIIHHHQIESLTKLSGYKNIASGFLLDFRKSDNTYFLDINDFIHLQEQLKKKSFNEDDMISICNPIKIEKRKLQVNYRYNIEKLMNDIENNVNR